MFVAPLVDGSPGADRAKMWVVSSLLCAAIHLVSIFLVNKGDGHKFRCMEVCMVREDPLLCVTEFDVSGRGWASAAGHVGLQKLACPHREEESANGNVHGVVIYIGKDFPGALFEKCT